MSIVNRTSVRHAKIKLRNRILDQLKTQKEEDRKRKSRVIQQKLFRTRVFKSARTIMFYIALQGEVDTLEMIKAAQKLGKKIVVPVCSRHRITIRPCVFDHRVSLKRGPYGVLEPARARVISAQAVDLVLVPGLAFDTQGNRLGRGKGFYDRFLRRLLHRASLFGLAFDFQVLSSLPVEAHDIALNRVIAA